MTMAQQARLEKLVADQIRHKKIHEIAVSRLDGRDGSTAHASTGMSEKSPFFMASTTKLFATALIMQLRAEGALGLDDPIIGFFPAGYLGGLHVMDGQDRTGEITIRHLLCHSSGLPDYFEGKRADGSQFAAAMLSGEDGAFTLDEVLASARQDMAPHFVPGEGRKALYSDTNFQLLGGILEAVTGKALDSLVETRLAAPLGLERTFLATPERLARCEGLVPLRNGARLLDIPQALSSTRLDGAGITTSAELLRFVHGFHSGALFPAEYVPELSAEHRKIFFPLSYGTGVIRFRLPWIFDPLRRMPVLTGHSGISGAFAYYAAERDVYVAGTLNQLAPRDLPYRFLIRAF